jgi:hypothetical protein
VEGSEMAETEELTEAQESAKNQIYSLELGDIIKGTSLDEGWTDADADEAELWYRHFLWMCYLSDERRPVAGLSRKADKLWHNHILNTIRYTDDCNRIFHQYLHHQPILGIATREQDEAVEATRQECQRLFSAVPPDFAGFCLFWWWLGRH